MRFLKFEFDCLNEGDDVIARQVRSICSKVGTVISSVLGVTLSADLNYGKAPQQHLLINRVMTNHSN